MPDRVDLEPSRCWVRHIKRTAPGSAVTFRGIPATALEFDTPEGSELTGALLFADWGPPDTPGQVFYFDNPHTQPITLTVDDGAGGTLDTIMLLFSADATDVAAQITYNDDGGTGLTSAIVNESLAPGRYFVLVVGYDDTVTGPFTLTLTAGPVIHGRLWGAIRSSGSNVLGYLDYHHGGHLEVQGLYTTAGFYDLHAHPAGDLAIFVTDDGFHKWTPDAGIEAFPFTPLMPPEEGAGPHKFAISPGAARRVAIWDLESGSDYYHLRILTTAGGAVSSFAEPTLLADAVNGVTGIPNDPLFLDDTTVIYGYDSIDGTYVIRKRHVDGTILATTIIEDGAYPGDFKAALPDGRVLTYTLGESGDQARLWAADFSAATDLPLPAGYFSAFLAERAGEIVGVTKASSGAEWHVIRRTVASATLTTFPAAGYSGSFTGLYVHALTAVPTPDFEAPAGVVTDGVEVLPGRWFGPAPLDGLNGRQGWLSATPERRMSDDGSLSIVFPNTTGEDGLEHVERFALLTDPAYRPGEEWLELYREPGGPADLLFVGTPVEWELSPTELTLTCADALVMTANTRATEVDYWDGAAPRAVLEHYTRLKVLHAGTDLTTVLADTLPAGWAITAYGHDGAWTADGGVHVTTADGETVRLSGAAANLDPLGDWEAELRARIAPGLGGVALTIGRPAPLAGGPGGAPAGGISFLIINDGTATVARLYGGVETGPGALTDAPGVVIPDTGELTLRMVARGEFLHAFLNGELVQTRRRKDPTGAGPLTLSVTAWAGAELTVRSLYVMGLEAFLARGANHGDHHLPGAPGAAAGGLRAQWFTEAAAEALAAGDLDLDTNEDTFHGYALLPGQEPDGTMLDTVPSHGSVADNWGGVWAPVSGAFSARWTGSIHLDLAAADRTLELTVSGGRGRLWVGGVLVAEITRHRGQAAAGDTSPGLRSLLGSRAGWYPIRMEFSHLDDAFSIGLNLDGATVTSPSLSPIGTFDQAVRYDSHRDLLGQITEAFGYQWRLEPRTLESGAFPGELVPRVRVGVDTDVVIDDLTGQEARSTGGAGDAIDGLLIDASGLANDDPDAPGLTGEILLLELAGEHLAVHQGYESLAEISERNMLEVRGNSLLATRAAPAETIAARPTGTRGLARLFEPGEVPLTLTGDVARMRWEPGDGVRLNLNGLRATDLTPRQLTTVAWPCRPDGIGEPTVGFRQRPRGIRAVLARALRVALTTARASNRR